MERKTDPNSDALWEKAPSGDTGDDSLVFLFHPVQVARLLTGERAARERGGAPLRRERRSLLLDDQGVLRGQVVFAQAWIVRTGDEERFHIDVEVSAPAPLLDDLIARLEWAGGAHEMFLPAGQARFQDITVAHGAKGSEDAPAGPLRLTLRLAHPSRAAGARETSARE